MCFFLTIFYLELQQKSIALEHSPPKLKMCPSVFGRNTQTRDSATVFPIETRWIQQVSLYKYVIHVDICTNILHVVSDSHTRETQVCATCSRVPLVLVRFEAHNNTRGLFRQVLGFPFLIQSVFLKSPRAMASRTWVNKYCLSFPSC